MRTLEDYEERIDHLDEENKINHNLYLKLKEKVGNRIGRKFEHNLFLEDERALDIQKGLIVIDPFAKDDIVDYANLLDFLKYGLN